MQLLSNAYFRKVMQHLLLLLLGLEMYPSLPIIQKQAEDKTISRMKFLCVESKGSEIFILFENVSFSLFYLKNILKEISTILKWKWFGFCLFVSFLSTWDEQ